MTLDGSVYLENISKPSIESQQVMNTEESPDLDWRTPIIRHLTDGSLPKDKAQRKKLLGNIAKYCLVGDQLYRRSVSSPMLRCLGKEDADYVLREVHEGICADPGARTLALKILRQGFYWPTLMQDATDKVKRCHQCQIHDNIPRQPPTMQTSILSPIPFAMWGIDLIGALPIGKGQLKFAEVAVDYMTKWVEAIPLRKIGETEIINFLYNNVITRFGISLVLVSDNGTQFFGKKVAAFLERMGIQHRNSSVAYPQANGQVEVTNRTILAGLKRRLEEARGKWVDELYNIVWAYRTTPRTATVETPFKLAYGTEALLPLEVGLISDRIKGYDRDQNVEGLKANVDLLESVREEATMRTIAYQQRVAQHFSKKVKLRNFEVGDHVLRQAEASTPSSTEKLMPNWEGPYLIIEKPRSGTYKL